MKGSAPSQSQKKSLNDCNAISNDNYQWDAAYLLASNRTKSVRHIEFQFKLLHSRIPTNDFLTKIGIKDDPRFSLCKEEPEKLVHLFLSCSETTLFWKSTTTRLKMYKIFPQNYIIENAVPLGLRPDSSKHQRQINLCFLLAR